MFFFQVVQLFFIFLQYSRFVFVKVNLLFRFINFSFDLLLFRMIWTNLIIKPIQYLYCLIRSEMFQIIVFGGLVFQNFYLTGKLDILSDEYVQLAEEYTILQVQINSGKKVSENKISRKNGKKSRYGLIRRFKISHKEFQRSLLMRRFKTLAVSFQMHVKE